MLTFFNKMDKYIYITNSKKFLKQKRTCLLAHKKSCLWFANESYMAVRTTAVL